jgi:hypothetical protein
MRNADQATKNSRGQPIVNGQPPTVPPTDGSFLLDLLSSLEAVRSGNFSVRLPGSSLGMEGKIADIFNEIVGANQRIANQIERVGEVVGREDQAARQVRPVGWRLG